VGYGFEDPCEGGLIRWPVNRCDQLERPVEPSTEPVGQQVVRLPGRGRGRVGAGVVEAKPEGEHRDGDDDHG
jgi:hypothetical protein